MAIKARTPGKTFPFTLKRDVRPAFIEPTDENPNPDNSEYENFKPTVFQLRVLDSTVSGILKDRSTKITIDPSKPDEEIGTQVNQNQLNTEVCAFGIAGVENYDAKFTIMKRSLPGTKSYEVATPEFLNTLSNEDQAEIGQAILDGNTVDAVVGNGSASQS